MATDLFVRDNGVIKQVKEVFIKDNGVIKQVKEGWVRDNGIIKQFYALSKQQLVTGLGLPANISHQLFQEWIGIASAGIRIYVDGSFQTTAGIASPSNLTSGRWSVEQAIAGEYQYYCTTTGDPLYQPAMVFNQWTNLTSNLNFNLRTKSQRNESLITSVNLQIRSIQDNTLIESGSFYLMASIGPL